MWLFSLLLLSACLSHLWHFTCTISFLLLMRWRWSWRRGRPIMIFLRPKVKGWKYGQVACWKHESNKGPERSTHDDDIHIYKWYRWVYLYIFSSRSSFSVCSCYTWSPHTFHHTQKRWTQFFLYLFVIATRGHKIHKHDTKPSKQEEK